MSPALVFVVPAVVTAVLAVVSGLAFVRARRPYLLWWAIVWGLAVAYYVAFISSWVVASQKADIFANIGFVTAGLGWVRVVGIWSGARLLVDRPVGRRVWAVVVVVSFVWLTLVTGVLAGQPFIPALTRASFASWYLLGAAELLLRRPRPAVGIFCGGVLLLPGIFGLVASQLVVDLTGSMLTNWVLTACSLRWVWEYSVDCSRKNASRQPRAPMSSRQPMRAWPSWTSSRMISSRWSVTSCGRRWG